MDFFVDFFLVVNDIDVHQLNLGPIKILVEKIFKKYVLNYFLNNKCIIFFLGGRNHYHMKKEEIYKWVLHYFFKNFKNFNLVMFHDAQT